MNFVISHIFQNIYTYIFSVTDLIGLQQGTAELEVDLPLEVVHSKN